MATQLPEPEISRRQDTLVRRVLTAAVGIPVIVGALWLGGVPLVLLAAFAALAGVWELRALTQRYGMLIWPVAGGGALVVILSVHFSEVTPLLIAAAVAGGGFLGAGALALRTQSWIGVRSWAVTCAAAVYPGALLASGVTLRAEPDGREWLFYAVFVTFASDTGAYAVGRLLGRHRMAPAISPGKTWEGATGGLLITAAASAGLAAVLGLDGISVTGAIGFGVGLSVLAQLGDLGESWLKRRAGAKESGGLLPGHGGILDRVDSIVLVLPVVYYYVLIWVS